MLDIKKAFSLGGGHQQNQIARVSRISKNCMNPKKEKKKKKKKKKKVYLEGVIVRTRLLSQPRTTNYSRSYITYTRI